MAATPANRVLFQAYSPSYGPELWVSDGTTAGTSLLKDIFPGKFGSPQVQGFTQLGTRVLFSATDSTHGVELWVTDGITADTSMLKDIAPGSAGGFVTTTSDSTAQTTLHAVGGKMVFLADDGSTGRELWVTDGTSAGTSLLKDIYPGSQPSNPAFFTPFGNSLLFEAFDGLHRAGAPDGKHGQELWITDGTAAGTSLLADLDPGVYGSGSPRNITTLTNGRAVFSAAVGSASRELWVTDGTASGTSLLKDINPGFYKPSNPGKATLVGTTGLAVFAATGPSNHAAPNGGNQGTELWVTDGTAGGTSLLKTFSEGYSSSSQNSFTAASGDATVAVGNKVIFTGADGGATAIWATDGSVAGTVKISANSVAALSFTQLGGKELFWNGTGLGASPWVTDGTAAGTSLLVQLSTARDQGETFGFGVTGGKALFNGIATGQSAPTIWVTNGTAAGTYDLGLSGVTNPQNFATLGGKVVFQAFDSVHGTELWISDGTFFGTQLLKDINTVNNFSFAPQGASSPSVITAVSLACFAAGSRILTADGERPVEALREGEQVMTVSGTLRTVRWVGHRHVDVAGHPDPASVRPIRIAPHTFGENQPHAALLLSPDHAVFVDGVLIPIRRLVNGDSIARIPMADVTYYHLELERHDVILAEGLSVESYLDTGDRANFINGGPAIRLFPAFAAAGRSSLAWQAYGYAPLQVTGPEVDAVRRRLAPRASHAASTLVPARATV